jgi:hypothetical protein
MMEGGGGADGSSSSNNNSNSGSAAASGGAQDAKALFTELFRQNVESGMGTNEAAAKALQSVAAGKRAADNGTKEVVPVAPAPAAVTLSPPDQTGSGSASKRPASSDTSPLRVRKRQELESSPPPTPAAQLALSKRSNGVQGVEGFDAVLANGAVVRELTQTFSKRESLDGSFYAEGELCSHRHHAVNFDALDAVYARMRTHEAAQNAVMMGLYLRVSEMELWVKTLVPSMKEWEDPWDLRGLFLMAMNPLRSDPEYHDFFGRLYIVLDQLPGAGKAVLKNWYRALAPARFQSLVYALQQYITCSFYMEEGTEPNMSNATKIMGELYSIYTQDREARRGGGGGAKRGGGARPPAASSLLTDKDFTNDAVNEDFDLKKDFQQWFIGKKQKERQRLAGGTPGPRPFSFCNYPFVLDAAAKAYMLRLDALVEQSHTQRQTLFQRMTLMGAGPGPVSVRADVLYLVVKVRRDRIVEDTLTVVDRQSSQDLKKPLKVMFEGEEGVDEGGVQKEFFQVMLRELLDPNYGMFLYNEKLRQLWFNADTFETPVKFILFGTLLGIAIYNQVILDVHFPIVVFKRLVERERYAPALSDLRDVDKDLHRSLELLLECEDASVTGTTFEVQRTSLFGEVITTELKPGGGDVDVTNENRAEFVALYLKHLLVDSIAKQFDAFCRGFRKVCDTEPFSFFRADELELLICGSPKLDFHELEKACKYEGYDADHRIVTEFWEVVHGLEESMQRKLLSFATGSDRAPIKGLGSLKFVVARAGPNSDQLPTSHTCFNHLLIPEYDSRAKLERLLMLAITQSEGFGLM